VTGNERETKMDDMTRDEMVAAGMLEAECYRDFAPARDDDPEAYEEMCRERRAFPWDPQA
jgi:hypothetical protein